MWLTRHELCLLVEGKGPHSGRRHGYVVAVERNVTHYENGFFGAGVAYLSGCWQVFWRQIWTYRLGWPPMTPVWLSVGERYVRRGRCAPWRAKRRRVVAGTRRRGRVAGGGEGARDPKPAEATCRAHPTRRQAIYGPPRDARGNRCLAEGGVAVIYPASC